MASYSGQHLGLKSQQVRRLQPPLSPALPQRHTTCLTDSQDWIIINLSITQQGFILRERVVPKMLLKRGCFSQIFQSLEHFQELRGPSDPTPRHDLPNKNKNGKIITLKRWSCCSQIGEFYLAVASSH